MAENSVEENMHNVNNENTADAFQEGSFEIKTQAEIPVISKTARIVEEVVISKHLTEHAETVRDSVKRTDVRVEQFKTDDEKIRGNG